MRIEISKTYKPVILKSHFRSCFEWESTFQSFVALVLWLVLCYYFEPWMVPTAGLLIFLKQFLVRQIIGTQTVPWDEIVDSEPEDDEEDDKEKVMFLNIIIM